MTMNDLFHMHVYNRTRGIMEGDVAEKHDKKSWKYKAKEHLTI